MAGLGLQPKTRSALGIDMGAVPSYAQQIGEAQTEMRDATKELDEAKKASAAGRMAGKEKIEGIQKGAPAVPELKDLGGQFQHKGMSEQETTDALQTMFAFAALGGMMTRAPMTAAMNAFAGGMKGMVEGDRIRFDREKAEFDRNLRVAQTSNSQALQKYRAAMEKHKGDLNAALQEIQLEAAAHNDTVTGAMARANDIKGTISRLQSMQKSEMDMQKLEMRLNSQWQMFTARMDMEQKKLDAKTNHQKFMEQAQEKRNTALAAAKEKSAKLPLDEQKKYDARADLKVDAEEVIHLLKQLPDSAGLKTALPDALLSWYDTEGIPLRSALARLQANYSFGQGGKALTVTEKQILGPVSEWRGKPADALLLQSQELVKAIDRGNADLLARYPSAGGKTQGAGGAQSTPPTNAKGWKLHVDAKGNKAYVGPNNEIEEVR